TDALSDPPGETERWHSEELVRLAGGFLAYRPPADAPPVRALPARENGCVTFGSFNNLVKLTPELIKTWAALLKRLPRARLLIKAKALTKSEETRQGVMALFAAAGVEPERVELFGVMVAPSDHLDLYNRIDVALDTFPYHGTTTTCEALWM